MSFFLLLAAALPGLFVDAAPDDAKLPAGIECVTVPAARASAWAARCATAVDTAQLVRLPTPGVQYRMNVAQATSAPWVNSNGWRYARGLKGTGLVEPESGKAALAAAEAWAFDAGVVVAAKPADLESFAAMLRFLSPLGPAPGPAIADFGFLDDGSPTAAENMNLFLRRNLLFRIVSKPDPALQVNAKPKAGDPSAYAYGIRQQITDARRTLRVYGSEVVIARLTGAGSSRRVVLLNYGNRPVEGIRVRLTGDWPKVSVRSFQDTVEATDISRPAGATEFSLRKFTTVAVIEMAR